MLLEHQNDFILINKRRNLGKVKLKFKDFPIIATHNGRPDFGVCNLETLEIATHLHAGSIL